MSAAMEGFRLSPQQQRLIRLGASHCFYRAVIDVAGPFDAAEFESALRVVLRRHDVLRTTFQSASALQVPLQVIDDSIGVGLDTRLASEMPAFDIARGPLVQVFRHELAANRNAVTFAASALIADAHTLQKLAQETIEGYASRGAADQATGWRFADVAQWYRDLLDSPETAAARHYWRFFDAQTVARQALASQVRADSEAYVPDQLQIAMPEAMAQLIRATARDCAVSERAWYLLPFVSLLQRTLDLAEITVAVRCNGRTQDELRPVLGPVDRFVPVRWISSDTLSCADAMRGLHGTLEEAQEWHPYFALPFSATAEDLQRAPFAFDCIELADLPDGGGASFELVSLDGGSEPFTLQLTVCLKRTAVSLRYRFDRTRLDPGYVRLLHQQYFALLEAALADANAPLSSLSMLTDAERLRARRTQASEGAGPASLVQVRFEEVARRQPDLPALYADAQVITYGELLSRVQEAARGLRAAGIAPDTPVGLAFDMSSDAIVALLGILAAGGAFVPLDSRAPRLRLEKVIDTARLKFMVVSEEARRQLADLPVTCWILDELRIRDGAAVEAAADIFPDHLAYVMFTSGSTGAPKGVAITHATVDRYVQALHERLGLPSQLIMATPASLFADFAYTVVFGALCTGRSLRLVSQSRVLGADTLANALADAEFIKIVPSHLAALADGDSLPQEFLRGSLMFGGEVLTRHLLDRVRRHAPSVRIFNHYGPTETTVGVCVCDVAAGADHATSNIPIGTPLAHTDILVLDAQLEPTPIGVPGHLYVREGALARGYLYRPDLTAVAFVPDPHSVDGGSRMYRTGDRGRRLFDGNIEFLGRADRQVKIRGYRVELAEIEREIAALAGIEQVVVKLVMDTREQASLIAYFVEGEPGRWSPAAMQGELRTRLPAHMLPAAYVRLDAFPRLGNGKIDLMSLPAATARNLPRSSGGSAPQSPAERLVCEIWRRLLDSEEIGATDNFFDVGGHSLLLIKLRGRLVQKFGREIAIVDLFKHTTVRAQAQYLESAPVELVAVKATARAAERRKIAGRGRRRKQRMEEHD